MTVSIPAVFLPGLWMRESSWRPWAKLFDVRGYQVVVLGRPGGQRSIWEITAHVADVIRVLPAPPVVIGHGLGGLVAQQLLGQGLARGGVAIAPAQFPGIGRVSPTQVRTLWPLLRGRQDPARFTRDRFRTAFAGGLPPAEADLLFAAYHVASPVQPLREIARARRGWRSPAAVDTRAKRGPLLLVGGGADRIVPPSLVRAAYRRYKDARSITELRVFAGRGHTLYTDHGWADVAGAALDFLDRHGLAAVPADSPRAQSS